MCIRDRVGVAGVPPNMEAMQKVWKDTKSFSEPIEEWSTKCDEAVTKTHKEVIKLYEDFRTMHGGIFKTIKNMENSISRRASSRVEYTSGDSLIDVMITNNNRLGTALIGSPEGDSSNNLKQVLDDFTSKLTKKFKNIDSWATGVGTWAGTVKTHTHPIFGLAGSGGGLAPVVILPGVTSVAASIGGLSPLAKVTRTFQRSANINNNKTSNRNLTGPLGDGSPITAEDTRVTLNWLNNILPTLNLTKEEEELVEILGSEPKIMIELLTRARQDGIEADLQTSKKIRCPFHRCSIYVFSEVQLVDVVSSATTNIGSSANNTSGSFKTFHLKNIIIAKVFRV